MDEFDEFTKKLSEERTQKCEQKAAQDKRERDERHALYDLRREAIERDVLRPQDRNIS